MLDEKYTAEEVAEIIRQRGDNSVTKRTVNYYAFEKNMFDIKIGGKKCFSSLEIDKIEAIKLLQTYTKLKLNEIKELINTLPLKEIKKQYVSIVKEDKKRIMVDDNITLLVSSKVNKDMINKIISHIKNIFT